MVRKLLVACAVMGLSLGVVQAQEPMEGDHPPMHPEIILGPPEGFEPPADMPPPEMSEDSVENERMMIDSFFQFMDTDGSGAIDHGEFHLWVRGAHMPMPPDGKMGTGQRGRRSTPGDHRGEPMRWDPVSGTMGDMPDGDGDGEGEMDGILRAGDPDLADLNIAPECSDELRESEQIPQQRGYQVPCGEREGNLIFRTICNMPGYNTVAISLPDGRKAACFGLAALRGEIGFKIIREDDGSVVFDTTWGKEAYKGLMISGPAVYQIKSTGGTQDGAVTLRFVDAGGM
jgi:hypothetical protein